MSFTAKKSIAVVAFIFALLVPVFLWTSIEPLSARFGTTADIFTNLGRLAGILGMVLFSMTLVLSTRLPILDRWFRGLNEVYHYHHHLGVISFLLLLAHPLLLVVRYLAVSVPLAALFLLPGGGTEKDLGIYALLGMIVVMIVTLFARFIYQVKLTTHKLFGVIFIMASFHTLLIPSDVSSYTPLRWYMIALIAVGAGAYLYRLVLDYSKTQKYVYQVTSLESGNNVVEVRMTPLGRKMVYTPGQFVFVHFKSDGVSDEVHPFSISSGGGDTLSVTVKNLGDYTRTLSKLAVGDMAYLEGPFGIFNYTRGSHKKQIWVAGGVGITPFLGMVRSFKDTINGMSIDLYYSVRSKKDLAYIDEFEQAAQTFKGFRIIPFVFDAQGYLTMKTISETSGPLEGKDFFLCGPPVMIEGLKNQLLSYKIPKEDIHSEEFSML